MSVLYCLSNSDKFIMKMLLTSNAYAFGFQLSGDKIVGLAKFFLGIGIPGDSKDLFNQIDSLACLENSRQVQEIYRTCYCSFVYFP